MFEEYKEAALKEEQSKKITAMLNIATGILFSIATIFLIFYSN